MRGNGSNPREKRAVRFVALAGLSLLGCATNPVQPDPKLTLAGHGQDASILNGFGANLDLTDAIAASAVRPPPLKELVDVQIAAMEAHVRARTGRAPSSPAPAAKEGVTDRYRLAEAAIHLLPDLDIDSGEAELGRVAARALAATLGRDAEYLDETPSMDGGVAFAAELRDGIGVLRIRGLTDGTSDRAISALNQWAEQPSAPRAILLDLSVCESANATSTIALVNALSPGRTVFQLEVRDQESGKLARHVWRTDADLGIAAVARAPLFIWLSSDTAVLLEAAAAMLREERGATLLGEKTAGSGHALGWHHLPGDRWFGFTIADVLDGHGEPLEPLYPDACPVGNAFSALHDRTPGGYQAECGKPAAALALDAALRYVNAATSR